MPFIPNRLGLNGWSNMETYGMERTTGGFSAESQKLPAKKSVSTSAHAIILVAQVGWKESRHYRRS